MDPLWRDSGMDRVWNGDGISMDWDMEWNNSEFLKFLANSFGGRFKI